ncbi:ABC transporter substrate-binding protein [Paenibacillus paeoniae]|uniref:Iron-siderophore ABC transporter substrate-binding protein n=1 Tax=Paenibacillus paeoniae TaxID=2292705 RepID=A0A371PN74_9BACL|nr:iron-siderophore ABC transporter substrate-binding protein [Paenibacillus paeoniae]REK77646.1 iron-siderophore ABC transporter substrate-binding protein [Paenibacillus paeoniae]
MVKKHNATKVMLSAMLAALLIMLTACGSNNGASQPGNADNNQPTQQPEANETRTIAHAMGNTDITGTPTRIVVLTTQGTETLLELGIKPVGAVHSWIGDPWYDHIADQMEGVEIVGDETQPNMELIASLQPDLILGTKVRQEKIYSQLSGIAPTIFTENLGDSMIENFSLFASALNKESEGEQALAEFDKLVEETAAKLGDKAQAEVSLARFQAGKARVYYKQNFAGVILDKLGIARTEAQSKAEFAEEITKEQISVLDGDALFYFASDRSGETAAADTAKEWLADPIAQNMKVNQNGQIYQVDESIWNSAGGILAAKLLVADIEKYFANIQR